MFDPRVLGAAPAGLRRERIEGCVRFRNGRFENTVPVVKTMEGQSFGKQVSIIGDFMFGGKKRMPPGAIPVASPLAAWARPVETGLRATWLGHSTVLVEIDGHRVLTDPVWGDRIGPVSFAGPRRFHRAPVEVAELPALDAIIISHDHYDHLDYPTVRELAKLAAPIVTSLGVGAHLEAWGVNPSRIIELDWWESTRIRGLELTAAPARHFSGRGGSSNRTAWSSFAVRGDRHRFFFSGDTGLTDEFEEIGRKLGPFDLVMLEVGAFDKAWGQIHLGPENALIAHRMLGGGTLLPVHWGTFDLALHPWEEPAEVLVQHAKDVHLVTPRVGVAIEPSRIETYDPWWRKLSAERGQAADDHGADARADAPRDRFA